MSQHPLLTPNTTLITKEINVNKIIGQIVLGVIVALSVRKIVGEIDNWKARRK